MTDVAFALVLIVVAVLMGLYARRQDDSRLPPPPPGTSWSTQSASQARADAALPSEGSEDATSLLELPDLPLLLPPDPDEEYAPDPRVDWWIDVRRQDGAHFTLDDVTAVFSRETLQHFGFATVYGTKSTGRTTYAVTRDAEGPYDSLHVSWTLAPIGFRGDEAVDDVLTARTARVLEHLERRVGSVAFEASTSFDVATKRAQVLRELRDSCDSTTIVALAAPPGETFAGRDVWDTMMSLGLRWGDMDLFHWSPPQPFAVGDDALFSVSTTTPPFSFLPEEIAADRVEVEDLVFHVRLARCAAPVHVVRELVDAAEYARSRLGGTLHVYGGAPLDPQALIDSAQALEKCMNVLGIPPGSDAALSMFGYDE